MLQWRTFSVQISEILCIEKRHPSSLLWHIQLVPDFLFLNSIYCDVSVVTRGSIPLAISTTAVTIKFSHIKRWDTDHQSCLSFLKMMSLFFYFFGMLPNLSQCSLVWKCNDNINLSFGKKMPANYWIIHSLPNDLWHFYLCLFSYSQPHIPACRTLLWSMGSQFKPFLGYLNHCHFLGVPLFSFFFSS